MNQTLSHEGESVREFYSKLPSPARVGIEATGSMKWFLKLMEELGIDCQVGHPATIRAAEPRRYRYSNWLDLRKVHPTLQAFLFYNHQPTMKHKLVLIGVGKLGRTLTGRIISQVFPQLDGVRIHRIDFCVDLFGVSVMSLAENIFAPGTHNFRIYKSQDGISHYFQCSGRRTVLAYDKVRSDKALRTSNLDLEIARLEVQLRGKGVPIRDFRDIHRYLEFDVLGPLEVRRVIAAFDATKPTSFLAARGFRSVVSEYGLDGALKLFPSSNRSFLKEKYLGAPLKDQLSSLAIGLRKGTSDWLADRIRFPRLPERRGTRPAKQRQNHSDDGLDFS
ncbi:MAG TPA: hypothetical protein VK795_06135 [Terriglobales bacterium]|nr:hypothetical protein [Terriglobales bacterium]